MPNLPPTPVQALVKQDCMSSNSSGSGEGSASTGKSRKRRTWGAPDVNPLFKTPTVMTRSVMRCSQDELFIFDLSHLSRIFRPMNMPCIVHNKYH